MKGNKHFLLIVFSLIVFVTTITLLLQNQQKDAHTGILDLDSTIDIVLSGDPNAMRGLLQFSTLACTHADGLGGPPKCDEDETEGTIVKVFPFLDPEGHHMRQSNLESWMGIQATDVYAVYSVSPQAYSDTNYPAGDYAIVFLTNRKEILVTAQVVSGKIVRIDNSLGNPPIIDFERNASEILFSLQK